MDISIWIYLYGHINLDTSICLVKDIFFLWTYLNGHIDSDISIWTHKIVDYFRDFVPQPYQVPMNPLQIYPFFSNIQYGYIGIWINRNSDIGINMSILYYKIDKSIFCYPPIFTRPRAFAGEAKSAPFSRNTNGQHPLLLPWYIRANNYSICLCGGNFGNNYHFCW
jgi:hypothetical protein